MSNDPKFEALTTELVVAKMALELLRAERDRLSISNAELVSACERARSCIMGLLHRTPIRDFDEVLGEIDAALERATP